MASIRPSTGFVATMALCHGPLHACLEDRGIRVLWDCRFSEYHRHLLSPGASDLLRKLRVEGWTNAKVLDELKDMKLQPGNNEKEVRAKGGFEPVIGRPVSGITRRRYATSRRMSLWRYPS